MGRKYATYRQTPEDDCDLMAYDWNITMGRSDNIALPTFQSDYVDKDSFKVVYAGSTEAEDEIEDDFDPAQPDVRHRKLIIAKREELMKEVAQKKADLIRQIGRRAFDAMYPFFKAKVESDELLDMDQEDLNSFMLSNISMDNISAMGVLYLILDLENQVIKCEEGIKAIDSVLHS